MEIDFPAAHSMDTCFFAVDRDGHVAVFETGEAGAVPNEAFAGEEAYAARETLVRMLPPTEIVLSLQGRITPGLEGGQMPRHLDEARAGWEVLFFLKSAELFDELIKAGNARIHLATEGVAVIARQVPPALFQRLHDEKVCIACFGWYGEWDTDEGDAPLATRGIFEYTHLTDNWIAGPYGCEQAPKTPVHIDQLPPRLRDHVKMLRYDGLCFTELPMIQPVEHGPCVCWGNAYIDVTGSKIRPIPGMEDGYQEEYDELRDINDQLDVEPPGGEDDDTI